MKQKHVKTNKQIFLLLFIMMLFIPSQLFAWWQFIGKIEIHQLEIETHICNHTSRKMYCKGYIQGQTESSNMIRNYMENWVEPNETCDTLKVKTTYKDVFVDGWANIKCNWEIK